MTKTSHKKNRPFDFKLIELVEPHPVLYQRGWAGLSTFECMKEKNRVWCEIAQAMNTDVDFCISRWNNLRGHFQRELRNCRELCPKEGTIRGSTWPYLEPMRFLESTVMFNKPPKPARHSNRNEKLRLMDDQQTCNEWEEYATESEDSDTDLISEVLDDESFGTTTETPEALTEPAIEQLSESAEYPEQGTLTNMQRMAALLEGIDGVNRVRVERRILAYLCKCQLRALTTGDVADLSI